MRRVVALVLAVGAALLLGAGPAWAHSQLDASNPADGASVATRPGTVSLTAATGDQHGGMSDSAAPAEPPSSDDTTARWLGGAGLLVGALGLGVGGGAVLRTRRAGKSD